MGRGDDESTDSSGGDEEQKVQGGGVYTVRAVGSNGEGGYHRRVKGQLAKIAQSEAARTVTIPEWNVTCSCGGILLQNSTPFGRR